MLLKSLINICEVKQFTKFTVNYRSLWTLSQNKKREENRNTGWPVVIPKRLKRWRSKDKPVEWPNDFLPFYWKKEETIGVHLDSGDHLKDLGIPDMKALIIGAEHSEALKTAPDEVRRQFTLEFATRQEVVAYQRHQLMQKMIRHPVDIKSIEFRITDYTVKIRNNLHFFYTKDPGDQPRRIRQVNMINRRRKLLKQLYYQDYDRFKALTEKLEISFTPTPLGQMPIPHNRKVQLRLLTKQYCDEVKDEKLNAYKEKLKAQQKEFIKEKEELEKWFKQQEDYVGIVNNSDSN